MSRQDKTITERHTRTLRDLIKRPENKVCADCKRNDPRWASWNLGVFVCIRCSGIHRSMGTHISKVKSVDLDVWTPEQMKSIQLWGNHRANLYWEAHLKPGHIPPDHKMDSFIRSKYESRRWALEGPRPADPSVLEEGAQADEPEPVAEPVPQTQPALVAAPTRTAPASAPSAPTVTRAHALLSSSARTRTNPAPVAQQPPPIPTAPAAPTASTVQSDLFSLDFTPGASTAPTAPAQPAAPKKDVKNDILSLFNSAPAANPTPTVRFPATASTVPTSMVGQSGTGLWGVQSGWNAPQQAAPVDPWGSFGSAPAAQPQQQQPFGNFASGGAVAQQNVWGAPAPAAAAAASTTANVDLNNVWGSSAPAPAVGANSAFDLFASSGSTGTAVPPKKDDAFGDLWGGFK